MFTDEIDGLGLGVDEMGCIIQDGWVGDYSGSNSPGYHCQCKHGGDRSGYWRESGVGIIWTLVPDDEGDGGEGGGYHGTSQEREIIGVGQYRTVIERIIVWYTPFRMDET